MRIFPLSALLLSLFAERSQGSVKNLCDIAPVFKLSVARRNQRLNVPVFLSHDRLSRQIEP
jgi:hypothetical protein